MFTSPRFILGERPASTAAAAGSITSMPPTTRAKKVVKWIMPVFVLSMQREKIGWPGHSLYIKCSGKSSKHISEILSFLMNYSGPISPGRLLSQVILSDPGMDGCPSHVGGNTGICHSVSPSCPDSEPFLSTIYGLFSRVSSYSPFIEARDLEREHGLFII